MMALCDGKYEKIRVPKTETAESLADCLRSRRNRLLAESDKYMLPDYPLSEEQRAKVAVYRANLRDLPNMEGFPYISEFPCLELGGDDVE